MTQSSTADPAALPYRPCVGIMLFNRDGLVLVARRIDMVSEAWQMPQGGIDPGEEPVDAAFRELDEEIGTGAAEVMAESADWLEYDLPVDLIGKLWKGRYRGQRQKWFAMRFLGEDADIDIETATPEFSEWKWVPAPELPGLIVPFKRALYTELVARFAHLAERARAQR
ncbi:MAG: RNA pyrophosphohydrolase [Alphaproteobacteria bacterium]|jgi:putative (di)nucleoside polyphosphate hydrolase|nr:RNA pyrophosphohydrolase [Alphaproteobacteria bacterium]